MSGIRPSFRCIPSSDETLQRAVRALVAELEGDPTDWSEGTRRSVEERLRAAYPGVTVRPRGALASLGSQPVWYVLRDGRSHDERTRRVLVVEDDRDLARMVTAVLESEGDEVRSVGDGQSALDLADTWRPDVIILDLGLPVMDGRAFATEYSARPGYHASLVIMSAAPDVASASAALGIGAWIEKPFDVNHLISMVKASLVPGIVS